MRLTEYHCGKAVLKNKDLDSKAAAKLAAYEDLEYDPYQIREMIEIFERIAFIIDHKECINRHKF